jgi:hypothetical protein
VVEFFRQGFEQGDHLIQMHIRHHIHIGFGQILKPEVRISGTPGPSRDQDQADAEDENGPDR